MNQPQAWNKYGAHAAAEAERPDRFVAQHVAPLLFHTTGETSSQLNLHKFDSEEQFWDSAADVIFRSVQLDGYRLIDWFPRAPGVYWSRHGRQARSNTWSGESRYDPTLGEYYSPQSKMDLIEEGGIGTIRLRPRIIDGEDCWLATALRGIYCHGGIPLAIPDRVLRSASVNWGDRVSLVGRVRFLQDAGLDDTAAYVHHARPLIVFVDELNSVATENSDQIVITPVALFEFENSRDHYHYGRAGYTFVQCKAGSNHEIDSAVDWIERYAEKHEGTVITNFDEQSPLLADAPLSYQRLVARTYDRAVIQSFNGNILVDRIDQIVQESVTNHFSGEIQVGHKIDVKGSAIINIDAVLNNVSQTIGEASGLGDEQKSELDSLVTSLKAELEKLKDTHSDEAAEVAGALEKAVTKASMPEQERKKSILELSAKGLKNAAELVGDIAPNVLKTARMIADFIVRLA